jgi:hypothetical protein
MYDKLDLRPSLRQDTDRTGQQTSPRQSRLVYEYTQLDRDVSIRNVKSIDYQCDYCPPSVIAKFRTATELEK